MRDQERTESDRLARAREALAAAERAAAAGASVPEAGVGYERHPDPTTAPEGLGEADASVERAREEAEPDPHHVARRIVLRQLTMAARSRKQLEDKLRQRGCDEDVARVVLDRMTEVGLVDDAAYARMVVRNRQETKGLASRAISHELRRKGVADEHIEAALEGVQPDTERDQARQLVTKRLRTMHGLAPEVQARRLAGFLARKGYGPGVSYEVIKEALDTAPEHQRD